MRYLVPAAIYVLLTTYAVVDIAQVNAREPYGMPKATWLAIVILAPILGAIAWIGARIRRHPDDVVAHEGPMGPEDDPAFRAWLDQQAKRPKRREDKE